MPDADSRRPPGVKPATFAARLAALQAREEAKKKRGRLPDLCLEDQLLLTLPFWREYRTQYHLAMEWQAAENTVRRTIERLETALIKSGASALPARPGTGGAEQ